MKKRILFAILFSLISNLSKAQSQFGIKSGYKINNLKSDDLEFNDFNQYSFGLSYLQFINNKIDLLFQVDYSFSDATLKSRKDYYGNLESLEGNKITINNLNLEILSNYYFMEPDTSSFHFGVQGGIGTTLLNKWINQSNSLDFQGIADFKQYFIMGITGGSEKFRIDLRYGQFFQNFLSDETAIIVRQDNYYTKSRFIHGTNNYYSITLTYYLTNLLYD